MAGHLRAIRDAEMDCIRKELASRSTILEIGAGTGYQAMLLAQSGHTVLAIDVVKAGAGHDQHYPVVAYDGRRIPARTKSVDAVLSSHVLEHVAEQDSLLAEVERVVVPGGLAVYVLPSATWRLWTSVLHYGHLVRRVLRLAQSRPRMGRASTAPARRSPGYWLRVAFAERHGEHGTAAGELLSFTRRSWQALLERRSSSVERSYPSRLYYSGYGLLGESLSRAWRRRLARVLGSSSHVFVVRIGAEELPAGLTGRAIGRTKQEDAPE